MRYQLEIKTAGTQVVTTADAKLFFRVPSVITEDDGLIDTLIITAQKYVQQYTRQTVNAVIYEMSFDTFPLCFYLPRTPLGAVNTIKYEDVAGNEQTLASSIYQVGKGFSSPALIALAPNQEWPVTEDGRLEAVVVNFTTGVSQDSETLITCIKMLANHWYENREAVLVGVSAMPLPLAVKNLLDMIKLVDYS